MLTVIRPLMLFLSQFEINIDFLKERSRTKLLFQSLLFQHSLIVIPILRYISTGYYGNLRPVFDNSS